MNTPLATLPVELQCKVRAVASAKAHRDAVSMAGFAIMLALKLYCRGELWLIGVCFVSGIECTDVAV